MSAAYLYQMSVGLRPVPGPRCRDIERATDGAVTVHDLRPDIFGPPPEEASAKSTDQAAA